MALRGLVVSGAGAGGRGRLLLSAATSTPAAARRASSQLASAAGAGTGTWQQPGGRSSSNRPGLLLGGRRGGQCYQQQRRSLVLIRKSRERLAVVVDMDECLIHSQFEPMAGRRGGGGGGGGGASRHAHQLLRQDEEDEDGDPGPRGRVGADLDDLRHHHPRGVDFFWLELEEGERVRVNMRPRVDEFLTRISDEFDTYAFTAATECYANPVLDRLDPTGSIFKGRFFRESCRPWGRLFLKDLRVVGRDMSRMVLVDNNPVSFLAQPSNGIPVPSFYDDPHDDALVHVADLIDSHLAHADDVRPPLAQLFRLEEQLAPVRKQLRLDRMGPLVEEKDEDEEEDEEDGGDWGEGPRGRKAAGGRAGVRGAPSPSPSAASHRR